MQDDDKGRTLHKKSEQNHSTTELEIVEVDREVHTPSELTVMRNPSFMTVQRVDDNNASLSQLQQPILRAFSDSLNANSVDLAHHNQGSEAFSYASSTYATPVIGAGYK